MDDLFKTNGLEIIAGNKFMEVFMSTDVSYYTQHITELCEKLIQEIIEKFVS